MCHGFFFFFTLKSGHIKEYTLYLSSLPSLLLHHQLLLLPLPLHLRSAHISNIHTIQRFYLYTTIPCMVIGTRNCVMLDVKVRLVLGIKYKDWKEGTNFSIF